MIDDRRFIAYLEDHLAGSEAGIDVARRLRRRHAGGPVGIAMVELLEDLTADQQALRDAIRHLDTRPTPSAVTRIAGLMGSVVTWTRRMLHAPVPSLLEDLETLAVGVWGKRLLWGALARKAMVDPRLAELPIEHLVASAEAQERELLRLRDEELGSLQQA